MNYWFLALLILVLPLSHAPAIAQVAPLALETKGEEKFKDKIREAQVQQYTQMLRPYMWRELAYVQLTCDLEPEQRRKIKVAAEASVIQAARELIRPRPGGGPQNVAGMIRRDIEKSAKETLSKEQLNEFLEESEKRKEALKTAAIQRFIVHLDSALHLTKEQREKLSSTLYENWWDEWESWVMLGPYEGRYMPQAPDQHLAPLLNAEQKAVWNATPKVSLSLQIGSSRRNQEDEAWWEGKSDQGEANVGRQ
jgi:hypothetical protein